MQLRIFKRSLTHELINTASGVFLILMGIVIAQRAGFLVRSAAKGWIPNDAITTLLGFNMVKFLPMILSLTIFLAVLLTLTRWHRDSEMAVWFSSGLGITKWILPIFKKVLVPEASAGKYFQAVTMLPNTNHMDCVKAIFRMP